MSLFKDIFTKENITLEDTNKIIPEITARIEALKIESKQYSEDVYVKYSDRPKKNKIIFDKCSQILSEMESLKETEYETKRKLLSATDHLEESIESIKVNEFSLLIVSNLIKINKDFIDFVDFLDREEYLSCMKIICEMETYLESIPDDQYIDVYDIMKIKVCDKREMLIRDLKNILTENVCVTHNRKDNYFVLKISKNLSNVERALLALFHQSSVLYPLHNIAKLLWNHFFVPIVDNIVEMELKENSKTYFLNIKILDESNKSSYKDVFGHLELLINFLKRHFCLTLNDTTTTLQYIGIDIRDNLSELLVKHCLEDTIPTTQEGLQNYKAVIADVESLEAILKASGIFDENTTSIVDYANNIDILFINKKCHGYVQQALQIMKKNLYDTVEVGVPYNHEKPLENTSDSFLLCCVPKSTIELLDFLENIVEQAIHVSEVCAGRLFCTVENILTKYAEFVPEYHRKLLQTIPQQVALFYNNCFYIAHILKGWNTRLCPNLPGLLSSNKFDEDHYKLIQIALNIFTDYVTGQIDQINDIMSESGLTGAALEELPSNTEKCVRQCLRQQELLKTVWHKVLSYPIYNETIGKILNSLCSNIISRIVKFEDISSKAAEQLIEVFKMMMTRGPKLFTDAKEVGLYVPSWYKLNEVNFVLGASLLDINDRWADGKGPLALQFQPVELKSLIRALFQNTDRRAAVLARIE